MAVLKSVKGLMLFLPVLVALVILVTFNCAECSQETYYSIHLASFKDLKRANNFVNTLTNKGKLVFWEKTDVPEKGEFYRVYLGKYESRDEAVAFWNVLKEEGVVSYFGVHEFKDIPPPDTTHEESDEPHLAGGTRKPEPEKTAPASRPAAGKARFIDNNDGTVIDTETNIMWTRNGWRADFFSAEKWEDAQNRCREFNLGGYTDWRLPTIDEWKSILDTDQEYPALVSPNPFEDIIVHMPYWSGSRFVYSLENVSENVLADGTSGRSYTVMLYFGRINHQSVNKRAFIMPVRSLN